MPDRKTLICSIHDVGPMFADEIDRLRALLAEATGSPRVALLVVPDHWRRAPIARDAAFRQKLRNWHEEGCEIILHGWCHSDESSHSSKWAAFKARHFTAREGEFLGLSREQAGRLLQDGRALLEDITGAAVRGFVAPAWLYGEGALQALRDHEFDFAEDHLRVWRPRDGAKLAAGPVISWASRSRARTASSLAFAALSRVALTRQKVVRIAVHPGDTSKPSLIRSIRETVTSFTRTHAPGGYAELEAAA